MGLGLRIRGVGLHAKGPKYLYKVWFLEEFPFWFG